MTASRFCRNLSAPTDRPRGAHGRTGAVKLQRSIGPLRPLSPLRSPDSTVSVRANAPKKGNPVSQPVASSSRTRPSLRPLRGLVPEASPTSRHDREGAHRPGRMDRPAEFWERRRSGGLGTVAQRIRVTPPRRSSAGQRCHRRTPRGFRVGGGSQGRNCTAAFRRRIGNARRS